jgi:hypothetical protein
MEDHEATTNVDDHTVTSPAAKVAALQAENTALREENAKLLAQRQAASWATVSGLGLAGLLSLVSGLWVIGTWRTHFDTGEQRPSPQIRCQPGRPRTS